MDKSFQFADWLATIVFGAELAGVASAGIFFIVGCFVAVAIPMAYVWFSLSPKFNGPNPFVFVLALFVGFWAGALMGMGTRQS